MLSKHTRIILILFILSLPSLLFGIYKRNTDLHAQSRGSYFFEKTRESSDIKQIVITYHDGNTISLVNMENFWRLKEADDYFVAFEKVNTIVQLIRDSAIYRSDKEKSDDNKKFENALQIKTFDNNGKIVDEVKILPKAPQNKYNYAIRNNDNYVYHISGNFNLSSNPSDWAQLPLLTIKNRVIQKITSDKFALKRRFSEDYFLSEKDNKPALFINPLLDCFWYLTADEIKHSVNFKNNKVRKVNHYSLTLFSGLIYNLSLYFDGKNYWMSVSLDKTKVFRPEILPLIDDNKILYDGWFFRINYDKGKIMSEFSV